MTEQIGSIAPGLRADIIALDGNPLKTSWPFGALYL
jgi:imidazolonepropionase-like amidohydrolase